jgi:hypothetical protein
MGVLASILREEDDVKIASSIFKGLPDVNAVL